MSSVVAWILILVVMVGALVVNAVVYFRHVAATDADRKYRQALADAEASSGTVQSPIASKSGHS